MSTKMLAVVPLLLGIALTFLTRHNLWFGIGAVWFLGVIAFDTGLETIRSVRGKLPRRRREALVAFLQFGGYSIAVISMATYFALAFWTAYRPRFLVWMTFAGIVMFFASGFVHGLRRGKPRAGV